jgi:hypothetical protein
MKTPFRAFAITALLLAFGMGAAHSNPDYKITTEDLAGNWVTVQLAVVPSTGLSFGGQMIPEGISVSSVTLWTFEADGSCNRRGFANFDGNAAELSVPLSVCAITLNADGTGTIDIESPLAGSSVLKIIVINKNEIGATSADSAVSAFTFKRQILDNYDDEDD